VWGGAATLGEEASIGVDVGPEEYMWGRVRGLAATDERIYVVDPSVPIVRVYDFGGQHLMNVGRGGQGPAEFVNPEGIVVASDGKIFRWLERLQIEEAKAMFERENYTVTRVAADLDMDLRTLERKFLRVEGCLPTEYKRRIARLVAGTTQLPPQSTTGA